ncbi:nucleotidyltransferase domain-containing protein [Candidatus Woesearchaeota archaeon]|nr:nucleotidyltransferase domain-containing protein [Candidatus Woesearchaeota archaeon]MCF7900893.1 nucleotidyltransferase domain-containing protein [Candidatus Woesearchaeota archaeon]MCF8013058.1 nucleotidyltransferase domain-containing protein [Candidatus Woesearchaeota archaeon]
MHIRELARNTNLHPNTIITTVNELKANNLVDVVKDEKKFVSYANNKKARHRKISYFIEFILESNLIDFLEDKYAYPAIILFGSITKGDFNENSDIDLCIITDDKKEVSLKKFEKFLGREIQLFVFNRKEFENLNKELFNNIINGVKLSGFIEVK